MSWPIAIAEKSNVKYVIDRWNSRIGFGSAPARARADKPMRLDEEPATEHTAATARYGRPAWPTGTNSSDTATMRYE